MELNFLYYVLYTLVTITVLLYIPLLDNQKRTLVKILNRSGIGDSLAKGFWIAVSILLGILYLTYQEVQKRVGTPMDDNNMVEYIRFIESQRDFSLVAITLSFLPMIYRFYSLLNEYYKENASKIAAERQAKMAMDFNNTLLDEKVKLEKENEKLKDQAVKNSTSGKGKHDRKSSTSKIEFEKQQVEAIKTENTELLADVNTKKETLKEQERNIKRLKVKIEKAKAQQTDLQTQTDEIEDKIASIRSDMLSVKKKAK